MLGTDFPTGSPFWIDLGSPDTAAAVAFYGAVFGWEFVSAGPEAGGYGFFRKDGRTAAGLGPLTEEGARPAWMTYFRTDDIEATVREVTAGGGRVRCGPQNVGEGRMAQCTDPQGAHFAVLQSAAGLERVSDNDALVWIELYVADPVAAIRFYEGLFGWRSEEMKDTDMTYEVLSSRTEDEKQDTSFGGVAALQDPRHEARWVPYFAVMDVNAAVTTARSEGGTVLLPATDVPDGGRVAWLADPGGAIFAVLKPNPHQS
ncbi:VOC family protein [Streptomyces sp. NBC_00820]|uniref:VOC family protein n=1 Tax=Streptomyces sp. NBC_00820 TaxID=2975842 RepID=UPI002ED42678|nr:VOC family protein [Streptomyces sp. NBC_00820]